MGKDSTMRAAILADMNGKPEMEKVKRWQYW
jgi:hypothetical protein